MYCLVNPIKLQSAPQMAAETIRQAITEGTLKPGQRLVEQKLAASLGIAQPTLREALKELEYEGLVSKIPQKGTYIATFNKKDCRDVLEVRMSLEVLAIQRCAQNMTPDTARELAALANGMKAAAEQFDIHQFRRCDADFHRKIAASSKNSRLIKMLDGIISQTLVYGTLGRQPGSRKELLGGAEQHRKIAAALASGDPVQARQVFIAETLDHWNQNYQVGLSEQDLPGAPSLLLPDSGLRLRNGTKIG